MPGKKIEKMEATPIKKNAPKVSKKDKASAETGFKQLELRFDKLEGNVSSLKSDVAELKSDVTVLKSDVAILKKNQDKIILEVLDIKAGLARTVSIDEFRQSQDRILTILDTIVKDLQELKQEKIVNVVRVDRHDKQLRDHDQRLGRLEGARIVA